MHSKKFLTSNFNLSLPLGGGLGRRGRINKKNLFFLSLTFTTVFILYIKHFPNFYNLDTDLGRDLYELSNIYRDKIVWLGPRLSPGLHASPIYYYYLFPLFLLTKGAVISLFITTITTALISLAIFIYYGYKKFGSNIFWATLLIATSLLFQQGTLHPGNGFTYLLFLFIGLTLLYFKKSFLLSTFAIGISLAFHPATLFALPILIYELLNSKQKIKNIIFTIIGLTIPWIPIILFEIITKGYILRQWMTQQNQSLSYIFNIQNLLTISELIGFFSFIGLLMIATTLILSKKRLKIWSLLTAFGLFFFLLLAPQPNHYLFGIAICILTTFVLTLLEYLEKEPILNFIFPIMGILFFLFSFFHYYPSPVRPIQNIETTVQQLIKTNKIAKDKKLAVLAALPFGTTVPQADDYRALLRMNGFNVLSVQQSNTAEYLILFIEQKNFDWQNWSNWEITYFGDKQFTEKLTSNNTEIIIYQKK